MDENAVKNAVLTYLAYAGWLVIRVNSGAGGGTNEETGKRRFFRFVTWLCLGNDPQSAGVSDILALEPETGRLWAIECKRPGKLKNVTKPQAAFLEAVRERGGVGIVVDGIDLLREVIENTKEQT